MTRRWIRRLLSWLCVLSACGPGLRGDSPAETPDAGMLSGAVIVVSTRWADVEATAMELRVRGHGFTPTSTLFWKEQALATTFLAANELRAVLTMRESVSWTEPQVSVRDSGPGGDIWSRRVPLPYPEPELHSFSPAEVPLEPVSEVRLTLTGRNFTQGSQVRFGFGMYPATVLSTEQLEVVLPESAFSQPWWTTLTLDVRVSRPEPKLTVSREVPLRVPDIEIQGAWPASLSTSTSGNPNTLHLYVKGSRLVTGVRWNGQPVDFGLAYDTSANPAVSLPIPPDARSRAGFATLTVEGAGLDGGASAPFLLPIVEAPVVHRVSPQWLLAGLPTPQTLTIDGDGWGSDVEVYWGDRVIGSSRGDGLSAFVPAVELARPGRYGVRVRRKSDGAMSQPVFVEVVQAAPAPVASGLEPAVVSVDEAPVRLKVHGVFHGPGSIIRIDGKDRATEVEGSRVLYTLLEAWDVAKAGTHTVTVFTPGPGGGVSLPLLLKVDASRPVPGLHGLSSPFATAGAGGLTLLLRGTGLGPYSVARWNSTFLPTRWERGCCRGEHWLVADVPAEHLVRPTVARLSVVNPGPGGGTSNGIDFAVLPPGASAPELDPRLVEVGSAGPRVTVIGTGFTPDTFVLVGDAVRATTFFSDTRVGIKLEAGDVGAERTLELQTVTPRPGGSVASAKQFLHVVGPRAPVLTRLIPGVVPVGAWLSGESRSIRVLGEHFSPWPGRVTPVLDWGGAVYPMRLEGLEATASIPGTAVASPGAFEVRVSRASEGAGVSPSALVHVVAERPVPQVQGVAPGNVRAGASFHVIQVQGVAFHSSSTVRWNGQALVTRRVGEGLRAVVPGALAATPGFALVTVETPAPGGGVSLPIPVVVE